MPIRTLKVDRRFVRSIATDDYDRTMVGGIVRLGNHLGFNVVGEGVETIEQLEILSVEGCTSVQGYLFGAAMTPKEFANEARRSAFRLNRPEGESGPTSGLVLRGGSVEEPLGSANHRLG